MIQAQAITPKFDMPDWARKYYKHDSPKKLLSMQAIWTLQDFVRSESLESIIKGPACDKRDAAIQATRDAAQVFSNHQIELFLRPAVQPGVDGGGRGAGPKQLALRDAFFERGVIKDGRAGLKYRVLAANGANQSGKTESLGADVCEYIRDYARHGDAYWVISRTSQTMRDIPQKTLWRFLPREMFNGMRYTPKTGFGNHQTLLLTLPDRRGTCEIWFWTEEMELIVIESARLNGVWWSECKREALFGPLQPRLASKGGWLAMDYVPREGWHRSRIRIPAETGDPDIFHKRYCMIDNQHNLGPGEVERQRRRMTPDEAAVRIDGEEGGGYGAVYPQFLATKHVIEPFKVPREWPRWRYLDWGNRHATAIGWATIAPRGFRFEGDEEGRENLWRKTFNDAEDLERIIVYREHYQNGLSVGKHCERVIARSIYENGDAEEYICPIICDPSIYNINQANMRNVAWFFEDGGLRCQRGPRVNQIGEHAIVEQVRMTFENSRLYFFDTCENHIREHQSWKYKEKKDGEVAGNEPFEDKDNDTCDGVKMFIATNPVFHTKSLEVVDTLGRSAHGSTEEHDDSYYAPDAKDQAAGTKFDDMWQEG